MVALCTSYVACIYIYNSCMFLIPWSLSSFLFISCNSLYFKVYFLRYECCYSGFPFFFFFVSPQQKVSKCPLLLDSQSPHDFPVFPCCGAQAWALLYSLLYYLSQESHLAPFFTFLFDVSYQIFMYTSEIMSKSKTLFSSVQKPLF